jgi:hypothetical protein
MALLSDLVKAVKDSVISIAESLRWPGSDPTAELKILQEAFNGALDNVLSSDQVIAGEPLVRLTIEATKLVVRDRNTPIDIAQEIFLKWDTALQAALGSLNVEVSESLAGVAAGAEGRLSAKLDAGASASQIRLTAALTIINAVIVSGSAISLAAEAASFGAVRTIAEAIQSWVWANGLGSFSSMAFAPQVNASLNPYLTRWYNSRATAQIPPVTDIIRFQLREVFLEGRREELVGTEARPVYNALMREHGFDEFHADSYWGAHWVLPSISQLNEMLFRNVIDSETWERFVRFNDVEPTTIPRLQQIIYNPYTRVDVRRMHRMGILDDQQLLQAYADLGFYAQTRPDASGNLRAVFVEPPDFAVDKAQALVLFTKVFNLLPELRQRLSKGHIDPSEVRAALASTGLPALRATAIYETLVKDESEGRIAPEKELTRGLITRAWKLRFISFQQGLYLLERLGWSGPESELILRVVSEYDDPLAFVSTSLGVRLGTPPLGAPPITDDEGE